MPARQSVKFAMEAYSKPSKENHKNTKIMNSCFAVPMTNKLSLQRQPSPMPACRKTCYACEQNKIGALKMDCTQHHKQHAHPTPPTWHIVGSRATSKLRPHPHTSDNKHQTSHPMNENLFLAP